MPENIDMDSGNNEAMILVTGATGRLTVLFHQQPRGLHLLVLRASSANRK